MKNRINLTIVVFLCLSIFGCSKATSLKDGFIYNYPEPYGDQLKQIQLAKTAEELMNESDDGMIDVRSADLSKIDFSIYENSYLSNHLFFDDMTKWPAQLPNDFLPNVLLESGKNPGFHLDQLHDAGINGESVSIAMIGQPFLVDHSEHSKQIQMVQSFKDLNFTASFAATAMVSITVGKNVGVAPNAKIYYLVEETQDLSEFEMMSIEQKRAAVTVENIAEDVLKFIDFNHTLTEENKIRVICIPVRYFQESKGANLMNQAINQAKNAGIQVLCWGMDNPMERFIGMNKMPYLDANELESYEVDQRYQTKFKDKPWLIIPNAGKTVASGSGVNNYDYYAGGANDFLIPYVSGLYALAYQVQPGLDFNDFMEIIEETGIPLNDSKTPWGIVVDPVAMIERMNGS